MKMVGEKFDLVDNDDKVIGRKLGRLCVKEGLLHRAVLVFLLSSSDLVYVQRRSAETLWYPNCWSASCTGHVRAGETYLEAAKREIKEELGLVDCNLSFLFKFLSPKWLFQGGTEWEYISVFEGFIREGSKVHFNREVKEGKYVVLGELESWIKSTPSEFTPDTLIAFEKYSKLKGGELHD